MIGRALWILKSPVSCHWRRRRQRRETKTKERNEICVNYMQTARTLKMCARQRIRFLPVFFFRRFATLTTFAATFAVWWTQTKTDKVVEGEEEEIQMQTSSIQREKKIIKNWFHSILMWWWAWWVERTRTSHTLVNRQLNLDKYTLITFVVKCI